MLQVTLPTVDYYDLPLFSMKDEPQTSDEPTVEQCRLRLTELGIALAKLGERQQTVRPKYQKLYIDALEAKGLAEAAQRGKADQETINNIKAELRDRFELEQNEIQDLFDDLMQEIGDMNARIDTA